MFAEYRFAISFLAASAWQRAWESFGFPNGLTLSVEAQPGFALPIRADSEVGDELAEMR